MSRSRGAARALSGGLGLAALVGLSACGETGGAREVQLVEDTRVGVGVIDNAFEPEALEVAAGTEVVFINHGRSDHNVVPVADDQEVIRVRIEDLAPGSSASRRLTEPGTYAYYCSIHGTETAGMIGTITVTEGDP